MDTSSSFAVRSCWHGCSWLKKKIPISYKRVGESLLYLGSLQINTLLFEQQQRTLTTSRTCWQYPLRPEFLIDFLQLGQTDIQKDSSLPFNIKNNEINVYCFFHQVRQGMDEAGEGWGVLAAFPNRLSFPRQQRSLCSLGKKWGNREALRLFQCSVDKISVFLAPEQNC